MVGNGERGGMDAIRHRMVWRLGWVLERLKVPLRVLTESTSAVVSGLVSISSCDSQSLYLRKDALVIEMKPAYTMLLQCPRGSVLLVLRVKLVIVVSTSDRTNIIIWSLPQKPIIK